MHTDEVEDKVELGLLDVRLNKASGQAEMGGGLRAQIDYHSSPLGDRVIALQSRSGVSSELPLHRRLEPRASPSLC